MMPKFLTLIVSLLLISYGFSRQIEITGVAATVNGKVITKKEVRGILARTVTMLKAKYPRGGEIAEREFKKAQEKALNQLIDNKIILSELEERGASIPDYVVDQEVTRIINDLFDGKEAEFRKSLKESGTTMRSFKETQKENILVQALKSEQFKKDLTPPVPAEIEAQYRKRKNDFRDRTQDKITFSKIFIPAATDDPESTPETQLSLAENLVAALKDGADFGTIATKHSADAYSDEAGQWPEMLRTDLQPTFAELLFESELGAINGPYKDPRGFTIVKVTNKVYGPAPPLSEIKDKMKQEVEAAKYQAKNDKWIKTLKSKAIIDRRM